MRQGKITAGYKAVLGLYATPGLPLRISKELFLLKRDMEPYVEWQQEEERKAQLENSSGIDESGIYIMTTEQRISLNKKFKEIQDTEVEWKRAPVFIPLSDEKAAELKITGRTIDQLDGFVEFAEE